MRSLTEDAERVGEHSWGRERRVMMEGAESKMADLFPRSGVPVTQPGP